MCYTHNDTADPPGQPASAKNQTSLNPGRLSSQLLYPLVVFLDMVLSHPQAIFSSLSMLLNIRNAHKPPTEISINHATKLPSNCMMISGDNRNVQNVNATIKAIRYLPVLSAAPQDGQRNSDRMLVNDIFLLQLGHVMFVIS